jgi:hypothetical protein
MPAWRPAAVDTSMNSRETRLYVILSINLQGDDDCAISTCPSFLAQLHAHQTRPRGYTGAITHPQKGATSMTQNTNESNQRDYSCEIMSFVVILILSALSHVWFIAIALCAAMALWVTIVLVGQWAHRAAEAYLRTTRSQMEMAPSQADSGSQVFRPAEIRQSVDC